MIGRMSADEGYARLRAAILAGELQPNERLVEADLVKSLGVSRSAVRTAILRLTHEGLVEHERNRGAKVRRVPEPEAVQILQTRAVLEALAAREAASHASEAEIDGLRAILARMRERLDAGDLLGVSSFNAALHSRILEISRHATVARLVESLNSQLVRFQYRTILVPGRAERSFAEHTAVVDAIASGDPDAAEGAMRLHLSHVTEALRESTGATVAA
jgi:DNA-binding GntR family transcriptional regulator